jgi:hypothetical protein
MKMSKRLTRIWGHSKGGLKRETYSHKHPHQNTREISNKQSDDAPKMLRKTEQVNTKGSRWKEIIKIRS